MEVPPSRRHPVNAWIVSLTHIALAFSENQAANSDSSISSAARPSITTTASASVADSTYPFTRVRQLEA